MTFIFNFLENFKIVINKFFMNEYLYSFIYYISVYLFILKNSVDFKLLGRNINLKMLGYMILCTYLSNLIISYLQFFWF